MANIKKSFNFRNGVQVDDDNLVVSATGLIGIGTSVPTQALDIRGDFVCTGLTSSVTGKIGVLTVTSLDPTEIIGAGVSIKSGIITGQAGDIVTYFGDGGNLLNLPTSQWEDTNAGFAVSSIYNRGSTVGIATTNPQSTLQIGNNPDAGEIGVGIASAGHIKASGIITATTFVGGLTGNVTGNVTGNLTGNVTGNVTGNLTGNVTGNTQGIHTGAVDFNDNVKATFGSANEVQMFHKPDTGDFRAEFADTNFVIMSRTLDFKNQAGDKATITAFEPGGISEVRLFNDGNEKLRTTGYGVTIFNQLDTTNLKIAGVSTFSGRIVGAATSNVIPFLYNNLSDLPSASTYHGAFAHVHSQGRGYFAHAGQWWELVNKESDGRIGTGSEILNVGNINSSGIITATTELNTSSIGVGTDTPANDIQVRKTGSTEIQVTSDTGTAGITVGRESGTVNTNNAEFRYGATSGSIYNTAQSLDIINYGTDNFNYYLSANNASATAGGFHWHKGINNATLMTLTGIGGSLGIGLTNPSTPLHVQGNATISDSLTIGNNITIFGSLQVESTFNGNVSGDLTGNVTGNINSSQTSTFFNTNVTGVSTFNSIKADSIGIANDPSLPLTINSNNDNRFFVNANGNVGIKTTSTDGNQLLVGGSISTLLIGVGTTQPISSVDFSQAGQNLEGTFANKMFMIPPKVTNAQRGNLAGLVAGAMIYNTNLNKLQVYNGSAWETITSS